ncbi:hypothetical protein Ciccas_013421, partial [Cichlidogyrus casuarinus]
MSDFLDTPSNPLDFINTWADHPTLTPETLPSHELYHLEDTRTHGCPDRDVEITRLHGCPDRDVEITRLHGSPSYRDEPNTRSYGRHSSDDTRHYECSDKDVDDSPACGCPNRDVQNTRNHGCHDQNGHQVNFTGNSFKQLTQPTQQFACSFNSMPQLNPHKPEVWIE